MSWSQACLLMPYSDDVDLRRSCAHLDLPYMCLSILALVSSWIRYYAACSRCCLLLQLYKNFEVCTACKLQRDIADEVCLVRNTTTSCIVVHILSHRCRTSPLHCRRFSSPSASCVIDPVCSTQLASDARNLHYACRPCTTRLHMCYDVPPTLHLPPRGLGRRHSRRTYHRGLGRRHQQSRTSPPPRGAYLPIVVDVSTHAAPSPSRSRMSAQFTPKPAQRATGAGTSTSPPRLCLHNGRNNWSQGTWQPAS
jgi:hypothetical protein